LVKVLEVMRPLHYHRISVLDGNLRRLGTLYEEDLIEALNRMGPTVAVGLLVVAR
jgi:hypothetical protein